MTWRPRQDIHSAIEELYAESRRCPVCLIRFVYGRKGARYCSSRCARNAAQRRHRAKVAS